VLSHFAEGIQPSLSIKKDYSSRATAISVMDTNPNNIALTTSEQLAFLQDLKKQSAFRAGILFQSQDALHVILYTQWESTTSLRSVLGSESAVKQLRPFSVAYLAAQKGDDTLTLTNPESRAVLINIISTDPERIDQLFAFWVRGAEDYWLHRAGVVGAALHRSEDNRTPINIAEWSSGDAWRSAAQHAGGNFAGAHGVGTSDPKLYNVVAIVNAAAPVAEGANK
jgi:hypothetical protein